MNSDTLAPIAAHPPLAGSRRSEVLAPVGDMEMCRAAVHNGADAVYVGFPGFNARGRTLDHSWEALAEMIAFCHARDVKVFLALNVLIFENELPRLIEELPKALALRPDAFIVQDLGLARLLRFLCPTQPLHASTQMTITSHDGIELTEDLGLARYVLGREVSLGEMEIIRGKTAKELEVFVHGALCVSYSGQCLTSEGFGGRSANRGQCAQSCRMEYDLIVDGEVRDMGERRYLVSPKDLCGLEDIPRLLELGIDSFKIEGRLKTPQYVASTVSAYRQAISRTLAADAEAAKASGPARGHSAESRAAGSAHPTLLRNLQVTYSRGFFNGWLGGVDHQRLVDGRYGSHRGLEIGSVIGRKGAALLVASRHPLQAGDGLFFADYKGRSTWGGRIFSVLPAPAEGPEGPQGPVHEIAFGNGFPVEAVPEGAAAYLNDSPALEREIRRSYGDKARWKTLPVDIRMDGAEGSPLQVTVSHGPHVASAVSSAALQPARNPDTALTVERARAEAEALAGTEFHLEGFACAVPPGLFLSDRELRKTRQAAVAALQARREAGAPAQVRSAEEALAWMHARPEPESGAAAAQAPARLNLLIRERDAIAALEGLPLDTVYLDFEHGKDYRPSVEAVRALGFKAGIATTRILKPAEYHNLKVIESLAPDAVLVRNLGALQYLSGKGLTLAGDFSLNASNSLAAAYLTGKGLSSLCPSYDLNQWQLFDLLDAMGGAGFEITVHQYLPSFHMEHCVFAAFLSSGSSFRDCGKPCESHRVELRDHTGARHPLKADQECRNTMFNGRPQSAARLVPALLAKGVRRFRVESLYEEAETLRAKVFEYARLIAGESAAAEVLARMGVVEKYGVMEGQLRNAAVHRDRKKT